MNRVYIEKNSIVFLILYIFALLILLIAPVYQLTEVSTFISLGVLIVLILIKRGKNFNFTKVQLSPPLVYCEGKLYVIRNKIGAFVLVISMIAMSYYCFSVKGSFEWALLVSLVFASLINDFITVFLPRKETGLTKIINGKSLLYKAVNVKPVSKEAEGSYIANINGNDRSVLVRSNFKDYDELVQLMDKMCAESNMLDM